MNRAILISIRPEWVAKIINGEKTIEIRRTAPKCELPIDVYIYCTKGDSLHRNKAGWWFVHDHPTTFITQDDSTTIREQKPFNGKVVAKFTLREVTEYITGCNVTKDSGYMFGDAEREGVYEKACLSEEDIERYCPDESFYAWHIYYLVIFGKPKELSEFMPPKWEKCGVKDENGLYQCDKCPYGDKANIQCKRKPLTKAPQSFCYIEID